MSISLVITNNCNLRCKYCYEGKNKLNENMSEKTITSTINFIKKQIEKSSKNIISIHGGEPFLEFERMKYVVSKINELKREGYNIEVITTTNCTIINSEIINFIKNNIDFLTISLDGKKDTHDLYRLTKFGKGTHDIVLKNALILKNHVKKIRVRMTFDSITVKNLYENIVYLYNMGFKLIVSHPNIYDENWDDNSVKILEKQLFFIKSFFINKDLESNLTDEDFPLLYNCNPGINVNHVGDIYPCLAVINNDSFRTGNIYTGFNLYQQKLLNEIEAYSNKCGNCDIKNYCNAKRCQIINKLQTGDYKTPIPIYCRFEGLLFNINY